MVPGAVDQEVVRPRAQRGDGLFPPAQRLEGKGEIGVVGGNFALDGDGIADGIEKTGDGDKDGKANMVDTDSDGDGIDDKTEGVKDSDKDSQPDFLDTDSDNDGIPDKAEGAEDVDRDGLSNYLDLDADGDGINDVFLPKGIGWRDYELRVLSRSGTEVFSSFDQNIGWDGSVNGKGRTTISDVYVWRIYVRDKNFRKQDFVGTVTLVK